MIHNNLQQIDIKNMKIGLIKRNPSFSVDLSVRKGFKDANPGVGLQVHKTIFKQRPRWQREPFVLYLVFLRRAVLDWWG